jgi:hypothetical protein
MNHRDTESAWAVAELKQQCLMMVLEYNSAARDEIKLGAKKRITHRILQEWNNRKAVNIDDRLQLLKREYADSSQLNQFHDLSAQDMFRGLGVLYDSPTLPVQESQFQVAMAAWQCLDCIDALQGAKFSFEELYGSVDVAESSMEMTAGQVVFSDCCSLFTAYLLQLAVCRPRQLETGPDGGNVSDCPLSLIQMLQPLNILTWPVVASNVLRSRCMLKYDGMIRAVDVDSKASIFMANSRGLGDNKYGDMMCLLLSHPLLLYFTHNKGWLRCDQDRKEFLRIVKRYLSTVAMTNQPDEDKFASFSELCNCIQRYLEQLEAGCDSGSLAQSMAHNVLCWFQHISGLWSLHQEDNDPAASHIQAENAFSTSISSFSGSTDGKSPPAVSTDQIMCKFNVDTTAKISLHAYLCKQEGLVAVSMPGNTPPRSLQATESDNFILYNELIRFEELQTCLFALRSQNPAVWSQETRLHIMASLVTAVMQTNPRTSGLTPSVGGSPALQIQSPQTISVQKGAVGDAAPNVSSAPATEYHICRGLKTSFVGIPVDLTLPGNVADFFALEPTEEELSDKSECYFTGLRVIDVSPDDEWCFVPTWLLSMPAYPIQFSHQDREHQRGAVPCPHEIIPLMVQNVTASSSNKRPKALKAAVLLIVAARYYSLKDQLTSPSCQLDRLKQPNYPAFGELEFADIYADSLKLETINTREEFPVGSSLGNDRAGGEYWLFDAQESGTLVAIGDIIKQRAMQQKGGSNSVIDCLFAYQPRIFRCDKTPTDGGISVLRWYLYTGNDIISLVAQLNSEIPCEKRLQLNLIRRLDFCRRKLNAIFCGIVANTSQLGWLTAPPQKYGSKTPPSSDRSLANMRRPSDNADWYRTVCGRSSAYVADYLDVWQTEHKKPKSKRFGGTEDGSIRDYMGLSEAHRCGAVTNPWVHVRSLFANTLATLFLADASLHKTYKQCLQANFASFLAKQTEVLKKSSQMMSITRGPANDSMFVIGGQNNLDTAASSQECSETVDKLRSELLHILMVIHHFPLGDDVRVQIVELMVSLEKDGCLLGRLYSCVRDVIHLLPQEIFLVDKQLLAPVHQLSKDNDVTISTVAVMVYSLDKFLDYRVCNTLSLPSDAESFVPCVPSCLVSRSCRLSLFHSGKCVFGEARSTAATVVEPLMNIGSSHTDDEESLVSPSHSTDQVGDSVALSNSSRSTVSNNSYDSMIPTAYQQYSLANGARTQPKAAAGMPGMVGSGQVGVPADRHPGANIREYNGSVHSNVNGNLRISLNAPRQYAPPAGPPPSATGLDMLIRSAGEAMSDEFADIYGYGAMGKKRKLPLQVPNYQSQQPQQQQRPQEPLYSQLSVSTPPGEHAREAVNKDKRPVEQIDINTGRHPETFSIAHSVRNCRCMC